MPKMIVSIDGVVIKEVQLSKDRTTLGRRPYNDIVIDNLAVSGEHAVLQIGDDGVHIEDLGSTNGTYINGKAIKRQQLQNADTIEIGKYKIRYLQNGDAQDFDRTTIVKSTAPLSPASRPAPLATQYPRTNYGSVDERPSQHTQGFAAGNIKVLSGAAAGRAVALTKVVTTIGKPGVAVAAITKRPQGFVLSHIEGAEMPTLNGTPIGAEPVTLRDGDMVELAGTQMQFAQS